MDPTGPLFSQHVVGKNAYEALPTPSAIDDPDAGTGVVSPEAVAPPSYSLNDFLTLAAQNNPTICQARLQISGETAKALQAGLYPNPTRMYSGEQIGLDVPGDNDSFGKFQGLIVEQRFVTAGKLRLYHKVMETDEDIPKGSIFEEIVRRFGAPSTYQSGKNMGMHGMEM